MAAKRSTAETASEIGQRSKTTVALVDIVTSDTLMILTADTFGGLWKILMLSRFTVVMWPVESSFTSNRPPSTVPGIVPSAPLCRTALRSRSEPTTRTRAPRA